VKRELTANSFKFIVRLPMDMKRWIAKEAKRNASSQNSEVVRCIRDRMEQLARKNVPQARRSN